MKTTLHIDLARCNNYLALLNQGAGNFRAGAKVDWYYSEPFEDGNAVELKLICGKPGELPYITMALVDDRYQLVTYLDIDSLCEYHYFEHNNRKYMVQLKEA